MRFLLKDGLIGIHKDEVIDFGIPGCFALWGLTINGSSRFSPQQNVIFGSAPIHIFLSGVCSMAFAASTVGSAPAELHRPALQIPADTIEQNMDNVPP